MVGMWRSPGRAYTARLLYKKPAETLKWLEQCGVRKLGNFMVQVTCCSWITHTCMKASSMPAMHGALHLLIAQR